MMGKDVPESEGFWTQDLEANTELRDSAFSLVGSAVVPLEEREGMKEKHSSETAFARHHQV